MHRLLAGVHQFYENVYSPRKEFFASLAKEQKPTVLFIACSDSRICPNTLIQAQLGDAFVIRNAGNLIPPAHGKQGAEAAAIEFALLNFPIRDIVICGHSNCGAMYRIAMEQPLKEEKTASLDSWLKNAVCPQEVGAHKTKSDCPDELLKFASQANVLKQVAHLKTHHAFLEASKKRALEVHPWYFDIAHGQVYSYQSESQEFRPICGTNLKNKG